MRVDSMDKRFCDGSRNARALVRVGIIMMPLIAVASTGTAAKPSATHAQLLQLVDRSAPDYIKTSRAIWEHPELGYQETKSSAALQTALAQDGFKVTAGVTDEPTAFVASYGEGKPVIGILGE